MLALGAVPILCDAEILELPDRARIVHQDSGSLGKAEVRWIIRSEIGVAEIAEDRVEAGEDLPLSILVLAPLELVKFGGHRTAVPTRRDVAHLEGAMTDWALLFDRSPSSARHAGQRSPKAIRCIGVLSDLFRQQSGSIQFLVEPGPNITTRLGGK